MTEESRPTPDPTILTTEQILREVENATKLLRAEIKGVDNVTTEKFGGIKEQLRLHGEQRVEQKKDTKDAVDAALAAAKEAVREQTTASERAIEKSETSFKEQLSQLTTTFNTAIEGMRREVSDLKERVTGGEGQKLGGDRLITLILAVVTIAALVYGFTAK